MSQQNEMLRQAILKILTRTSLKFFGCIISKFDIRTTDDPKCRTAYCTLDKVTRKPVIVFNNTFIENELKNVQQVMYVLLHEILHFVDGHLSPIRTKDKHQKFFNLAADHIINTLLDSEAQMNKLIEAPEWIYHCQEFVDKKTTLNEVYLWLMENKKHYEFQYNSKTGMLDIYENGNLIGSINPDLDDDIDEQFGEEFAEELKADIRAALRNMKNRGNSSSDLFKYLEELVEIKLPWDVILENDIKKTRVKSTSNRSWKSLRKKLLHVATLPSFSTEEVQDHLYIIKDTSGSLWDNMEDQNKFANLILQSASYFKSVKVIQHDTIIQNILELDQSNFEMNREKIFEMHGGGGTSHKDVFDYIEKEYFENQEEIGMVILATDYESDVEQIWNEYEFHNFIPVKVLCTTKSVISTNVDSHPVYV